MVYSYREYHLCTAGVPDEWYSVSRVKEKKKRKEFTENWTFIIIVIILLKNFVVSIPYVECSAHTLAYNVNKTGCMTYHVIILYFLL